MLTKLAPAGGCVHMSVHSLTSCLVEVSFTRESYHHVLACITLIGHRGKRCRCHKCLFSHDAAQMQIFSLGRRLHILWGLEANSCKLTRVLHNKCNRGLFPWRDTLFVCLLTTQYQQQVIISFGTQIEFICCDRLFHADVMFHFRLFAPW